MSSATAILIHPPQGSPALPSWEAAVVAGALAGTGMTTVLYDANLEFYRQLLFSLDRVDLNHFQKPFFYDPRQFLVLRKKINDCLIGASQADFPMGFPGGSQGAEKEAARTGTGKDIPFARACQQGLGRELDRHDPGLAILFVTTPAQMRYAHTMADYIKARNPGTWVVAMANPGAGICKTGGIDRVILEPGCPGLVLLADFLFETRGIRMDPRPQGVDFKGVFLDDYLVPDRLLPVQPLFFQDPGQLAVFLEDQVRCQGVEGFVFLLEKGGPGNPAQSQAMFGSSDTHLPDRGPGDSLAGICQHLGPWLSKKSPGIYFSIQARMSQESPDSEPPLDLLFASGLKLIQWEMEGDLPENPSKILWKASKLGLWNHVTLSDRSGKDREQIQFMVNNPNMVHSFEAPAQAFPRDLGGYQKVPRELMDYGALEPLPGIPFWEHLGDPTLLLAYLGQMTQKALAGLRADIEEKSLICLGSRIIFYYQSPQDLPQGILDEICKMVAAGGSVDTTHVRSNLERAYLIGYAMENGVLVGNSSLKHPRKEFILRINQVTGLDFTDFVERGYTSVRPEYRAMGVGAKLLAGLTQRAGAHKVFSIISEDNLATQKIAVRNRTRKIFTYFSEKLDKEMGVWMPESMIESSQKPGKQGDPEE